MPRQQLPACFPAPFSESPELTPSNTPEEAKKTPWYAQGLRFTCQRCGRCCTGAPGYVWLDKHEIHRIARFLKLTEKDFLERHCRQVFFKISLLERENGDCIFFTPAGCRIYPVRPVQCTNFPFWDDILKSPENWAALRLRCPGVGNGRLYTTAEIEEINAGKRIT